MLPRLVVLLGVLCSGCVERPASRCESDALALRVQRHATKLIRVFESAAEGQRIGRLDREFGDASAGLREELSYCLALSPPGSDAQVYARRALEKLHAVQSLLADATPSVADAPEAVHALLEGLDDDGPSGQLADDRAGKGEGI